MVRTDDLLIRLY